MKKFITTVMLAMLLLPGSFFVVATPIAEAGSASFNSNSGDPAVVRVSNYTDCPDCIDWSSSVSADPGDVVAVSVAFINRGDDHAFDSYIKLSPKNTGTSSSHTFSGSIHASNAATRSGSANVYLSESTRLEFIPGSPKLYKAGSPIGHAFGQNGNEVFTSGGYDLGDINIGPAYSGGLVVHYRVIEVSGGGDERPEVDTLSATDIDDDSALLRGDVIDTGDTPITRFFRWDDDSTPSNTLTLPGTSSSTGTFSRILSGLSDDTTYYYQACVEDDDGDEDCGAIRSFTTDDNGGSSSDEHPDVSTDSATGVDDDRARLNGEYDMNDFDNGVVFFAWSDNEGDIEDVEDENEIDDIDSDVEIEIVESDADDGESDDVDELITGLDEDERYYFRLCVEYDDEDGDETLECGNVRSFETDREYDDNDDEGDAPDVSTLFPTFITLNAATCRGTFDSNDLFTQTRFSWGRTSSLGSTTSWVDRGTSSGSFDARITGLSANTTYYCRAEAQNEEGFVTGNTVSFRTSGFTVPTPPTTPVAPTIIIREIESQGEGSSFVELDIDDNREIVTRGDVVTYEVYYQNISTTDLEDVIVRVFLPENLRFVSSTEGRFSPDENAVTLDEGDLDAGDDNTFTVTARVLRGRGGDAIVGTAILVHTHPDAEIGGQEDAIAYDADIYDSSRLGASIGALGIGSILIALLIIILLVLLIMVAARKLYGPRTQ